MPDPNEIPVRHVVNMRSQGLSNNQIVQNLQRFGYSVDQINNALNQADIKVGMSVSAQTAPRPANQKEYGQKEYGELSADTDESQSFEGNMEAGALPEEVSEKDERISEIAEAIIEEKWNDLMESVGRIVEWKESVEARLSKTEQQVADLTNNFNKLHEGVLGKISDYDHGLVTVTTEIKALEKVFQKILPGFVENVHELSRITETMKRKGE